MKTTLLIIYLGLLAQITSAQIFSGVVSDKDSGLGIPGANVYWANTTDGVVTDTDGGFALNSDIDLPAFLVVSFVGYTNDTLKVNAPSNSLNISLSSSVTMNEVVIQERENTFSMSTMDNLNTEQINRGILRKAACCNLSESFETSASVDVVMNDAITGTRKIQMLGLEGVFVQNMFESVPFARGLSNALGFDQIPGPWISSVQLTKGIGTMISSYESMTGQINLEFLKPTEEALFLDVFANQQSRFEANAVWAQTLSDRWSTALFVNGASQQKATDNNNDGFMDMPLRKGVSVMNRWKYTGDFVRSQLILRVVDEERNSGQMGYNYDSDFGTTDLYGFGLLSQHYEAIGKLGLLAKQREDQSIAFQGIYSRTFIDSYFGNTVYEGQEETLRLIGKASSKFSTYSDHKVDMSVTYLYDSYNESYADSAFSRIERVPGVGVEYSYSRPRLTFVAGVRTDFHNLFGTQVSPRIHAKYNLKPLTALRFTAGTGFRSANVYADQIGLLASSRRVSVLENINAEKAFNAGVSFLHKFTLFDREAVLNADYYYTEFENQLVIDRDNAPSELLFYNLDGQSYAHSFQVDFQAEMIEGLALKLSYKFQEVRTQYLSGMKERPFVPKQRALVNLGYTTKNGKWYFDVTGNYFGTSRIPSTASNPEEYRLSDKSADYFLFNCQVTRIFGDLEVYIGSENIGNFIQANAIIDPENPFGNYFDATLIYGPVNGRTIYAGARYKLNLKNKN
jgi:hypothetical protein